MNKQLAGLMVLALFILSGFSGLIYQSIWTQYLGLLLGHAAYAQSLVLALFMGGMAVGAWAASRWSLRLHNLILGYAVIELGIGLAGLVFHPVFEAFSGFSHNTALPLLAPWGLASTWQWLGASALILPQCLLLGATFPLLSAGYLRLAPREDGRVLGGLYFSNSIGAGFGALAATFLLLPAVGMPGAMLTAGLINLLVALGAWLLSRRIRPAPAAPATRPRHEATGGPAANPRLVGLILGATALSSACSFVYEIGWIRMLNQALGTTIHAFELMLAAFIFGLAFGGLWVNRSGARLGNVISTAALAQVAMGVAALISVVVFTRSFEWVGWLMRVLQRTPEGYALFNLGSGLIALLVMFPAAFFAGMTLPLFTMILLRSGEDERSIGRVYAANTLGAIAGVFLAMHLLIPLLGLRLALTLAATVDALLGLYLLRVMSGQGAGRKYAVATAASVGALAFSLLAGQVDPAAQASGVFRGGQARLPGHVQVPFLKDGKTATVSVMHSPTGGWGMIATNGKPDAMLALDADLDATGDELTMMLLAGLPLAIHDDPADIAVIGWGSGLTTHALLTGTRPERVETIEIEPAMWEGAKLFHARNHRAYDDPRSVVVFEDARTHFAGRQAAYDVIVSEPSNPWVSGVASLFTREFYEGLSRQLKPNGLMVQWLHSYEISNALLAQMIRSLLDVFPHARVYISNTSDLILVAGQQALPEPDLRRITSQELLAQMARVSIASNEDLRLRLAGDEETLATYARLFGARAHSDYYPTLALQAPADRFTNQRAALLQDLAWNGLPIHALLRPDQDLSAPARFSPSPLSAPATRRTQAAAICNSLKQEQATRELDLGQRMHLRYVQAVEAPERDPTDIELRLRSLAELAGASLGLCSPEELQGSWIAPDWRLPGPVILTELRALYALAASQATNALPDAIDAYLQRHAASVPAAVRAQLLTLAGAALAGQGQPSDAIRALQKRHGAGEPAHPQDLISGFLLTWADGQ